MRKYRRHVLVLAGVVSLALVIARTNNVQTVGAVNTADAPAVTGPASHSDEGLLEVSAHSPVLAVLPQANGSTIDSSGATVRAPLAALANSQGTSRGSGSGWRNIAADVQNVGVGGVDTQVTASAATASTASLATATPQRVSAHVATSTEAGWRDIADNLEALAHTSTQGSGAGGATSGSSASPTSPAASTWHELGTAVLTSTSVSEQAYLHQLSAFYAAVEAQTEARFFAALEAQQIAAQQAAQLAAQQAAQQAAQRAAQVAAEQAQLARERAAPAPAVAAPAPAASSGGYAGGVWAELRQCESGGNYAEDTGNGFYGAYQFLPSTWRGLGYPGMPNQAPPAMQDAAAAQLQARSGWGQWPECARKLGLL
jgi:resuscitation-promoting factor RpfB